MLHKIKTGDRFTGCLLGGAVGDALGAPVEFKTAAEIHRRFGPEGLSDYEPAYGRKGAITDDTQMTLFTAEGLILHRARKGDGPIVESVYHAYLRWLSTQKEIGEGALLKQHGSCGMADGILTGFPALHSRRAPGNACLSSLSSGRMGTIQRPINNSKGCGGVMRIAPAGLFLGENAAVFDAACEIAAITHGHPTGYLAAGCQALIIHRLRVGASLQDAVESALAVLETRPRHEETSAAVRAAIRAWKSEPASFDTVENLGAGWIAEEALAIGVYCALAAGEDFEKGVRLAVNHGGDSDSAGAVAGNILGALLGRGAIPQRYLESLELAEVIEEIGVDLFERADPAVT
jgi:ADP-ribosyl-[dinitrogen reductase] hydrolase